MQPSTTPLKSEPGPLAMPHSQHQHHQNYQINTNPDMYRHNGTVQLYAEARQLQSTSPVVSQQNHQRYDATPTKKRVYFTPEQRSQLEELYKNQQYPTRDDKSNLAKSLNIDENKIQVWFQNRRARDRRPRCPRRKMRSSHGFNTLNLMAQHMAHASPYAPSNLFQNLNHHDQTGALNPYATSRQFGLGYGMNIFAPNWPTQQSIQNTTASAAHHLQTQQGRSVLDGWNAAPYTQFNGMNSRAASDNSFDGTHTPNEPIEQI